MCVRRAGTVAVGLYVAMAAGCLSLNCCSSVHSLAMDKTRIPICNDTSEWTIARTSGDDDEPVDILHVLIDKLLFCGVFPGPPVDTS